MAKKYLFSIPVAVLFFVLSITGIAMFIHMEIAGFEFVHQITGLLFVITGIVHLLNNWKPFKNYFSKKYSILSLTGILLLTTVLFFVGLLGGENPLKVVAMKIPYASVSSVAALLQISNNDAVMRIKEKTGIEINEKDSIISIAEKSGKDFHDILALLLGNDEQSHIDE